MKQNYIFLFEIKHVKINQIIISWMQEQKINKLIENRLTNKLTMLKSYSLSKLSMDCMRTLLVFQLFGDIKWY